MILYVDCSNGVSGDMLLAGLLDLGVPLVQVSSALRQSGLSSIRVVVKKVVRQHLAATQMAIYSNHNRVQLPHHAGDFFGMIQESRLSHKLKASVCRVLQTLAEAEGRVHQSFWRTVCFHQLRDVDTLVNLVGFCAGLSYLKVSKIYASTIPIGNWHQDHIGKWCPRPGPATLCLLQRFRVERKPDHFEWTTPTGASLLRSCGCSDIPGPFQVLAVGHGTGTHSSPRGTGFLRILLGKLLEVR